MKKNIISIVCGVVAAVVIITGALVSLGNIKEKESIGSSSALTIALNDAGVGKEEAKHTKATFEKEDGVYIFDVEFDANGNEYEYYIDAKTGEVLKRDVEIKDGERIVTNETNPQETTTANETTSSAPSQNETTKAQKQATKAKAQNIGIDEAKRVALKNAGASESQVRFTKAKLDYDDGVAKYEIEFVKGNTKYEYEINAKTGEIIDFEKETKSSKSINDDDDDFDDDNDDFDD